MTTAPDRPAGLPSAFFLRCEASLRASASIGPTVDLACGRGRHASAAAALGLPVVAVDRDRAHLAELAARAAEPHPRSGGSDARGTLPGPIRVVAADLEASPPPLRERHFGAVLVFRYLHRPLLRWIESLVAPGGLLLYETFTRDQRRLGWGPRRDAFLLARGELARLLRELEVEIFEEGLSRDPKPAYTARLLARRPR